MLVELSRFKTRRSRALADLSMRALRWSPWSGASRWSPWSGASRLGGAIGAWGATAQSAGASGLDEPVITGERTPGPAAAAAAGDAALAAGRADRERARQELLKSSKLREQSLFKFFKPVCLQARAMRPRLQLQRARRSSARCGTSSGPRRWRRRPRSRSSDK
jgi:hypothetical protein